MDPIAWFREQNAGAQAILAAALLALGAVALAVLAALTVALAAVVGTFVLGPGPGGGTAAPDATFAATPEDGAVALTHEGGDPIPAGELEVVLEHEGHDHVHVATWAGMSALGPDEEVGPGDSVTVPVRGPGDRIRVVWRPDEGQSEVLFEYTVR